jgi:hypothetical protein
LERILIAGSRPGSRGPFVSAKGPKTILARSWPSGFLRHHPESRWLGNSLRSNSPRRKVEFGTVTQPRPKRGY